MPYLIMCKDSKAYKVFRFCNVVKIGRAGSNDIVLNDFNDLAISRHHAYIEQREGRHILFDQSANGTFVDDERIERCLLSHGTVFRIPQQKALSKKSVIAMRFQSKIVKRWKR